MKIETNSVRRSGVAGLLIAAASAGMAAGCEQERGPDPQPVYGANAADTLVALEDFETIEVDGYAPSYRDDARGVLAVNSILYENQFGAAETPWRGGSGRYDVTIETMLEEDGESTYRLYVNGRVTGEFTNPRTDVDFSSATHTWDGVPLRGGDTIRVASSTHSNGLIPEGDGYGWARGRWRHLVFTPVQ
jgi:hypothetical protein